MILDVKEICESLGLTAVYSEKKAICTNSSVGKKDCGTVYRLRIKTSKLIPKLHRSKKRESQWKPAKVYSHRAIIDIQPTNNYVEMTCITVDNPTALFVTDNFIVTHNTRLMTEKVRQLLKNNVDPKEIAVITFTNIAAAELKERLGDDYKPGLFVGTIHALANYFLLSSGIKTGAILDNEEFDKLFSMVKQNPQCVKRLEWILLDEAQDSDELQFEFLFKMINPENFFICGDTKQCIYQFKGSEPELLLELSEQDDVHTYDMNENYRNGEKILSYARRLIKPTGQEDTSIAMRNEPGSVYEISFNSKGIVYEIKKTQPYGSWAILCRTNRLIAQIQDILKKANIPFDTFRQGDLTKDELVERLNKNTVKVLTVHSAKGLEWDNVIVYGAKYYSPEERNVCYVAATRARNQLLWVKN